MTRNNSYRRGVRPVQQVRSTGVAACLTLTVMGLTWTPQAPAAEGLVRFIDATHPFASVAAGYDSNLFRLDDDAPAIGKRADQFAVLSVGFNSDVPVSQQRFELNGTLDRTLYDNHSELNFTGAKAAAIWHWSAGQIMSGTLGYRFDRALRDFANQFNFDKTKGVRNDNRILGNAIIDLAGPWKLGVRGEYADISITNTALLDLQRTTGGATLSYVSKSGNELGFDAQVSKGDYDANSIANFKEYNIGPTIDWKLSASTRLNAKVGYTSRNNNDAVRSDYSDVTGRVEFTVNTARKHKLVAAVWRDVSNLGDEIADFALIHGISLEPSWQLSNGVTLRGMAGYQARDFKVSDPSLDRQDDVYTLGAYTDVPLGRTFKLSFGVDAERRTSNRVLQDYDFATVQLQITGKL